MTREQWEQAMNGLDSELIEEAAVCPPRRRHFTRYAVTAAALVLCVGAAGFALYLGMGRPERDPGPAPLLDADTSEGAAQPTAPPETEAPTVHEPENVPIPYTVGEMTIDYLDSFPNWLLYEDWEGLRPAVIRSYEEYTALEAVPLTADYTPEFFDEHALLYAVWVFPTTGSDMPEVTAVYRCEDNTVVADVQRPWAGDEAIQEWVGFLEVDVSDIEGVGDFILNVTEIPPEDYTPEEPAAPVSLPTLPDSAERSVTVIAAIREQMGEVPLTLTGAEAEQVIGILESMTLVPADLPDGRPLSLPIGGGYVVQMDNVRYLLIGGYVVIDGNWYVNVACMSSDPEAQIAGIIAAHDT